MELPVGTLFCVIDGPTRGRPWSGAAVRTEFRRLAARAGVRRRFAPHQLRHAHAAAREEIWHAGAARLLESGSSSVVDRRFGVALDRQYVAIIRPAIA